MFTFSTDAWIREFGWEELSDLSRWETHRNKVRHPASLFSPEMIRAARENRTSQAEASREAILRAQGSKETVDAAWTRRYIPATTPGATSFTMCPVCEFAPLHGAYDWHPERPGEVVCKGCGTVYPHKDYPETIHFQSRFDPRQTISYFGGKSWGAYQYKAVHSSFSGLARVYQCRHAARRAEELALAYALSGDRSFAEQASLILLRFADVHPRYLVHNSYGEYADMEPTLAAPRLLDLPEEKWCTPGNERNRKMHGGYNPSLRWGATGGMEGTGILKLATAYDLVAEIFDDKQRLHIEKNLFLNAATLLYANPDINNKTGINRSAVAIIGMICGDPLLVRFGLDGFLRAVRDWWLPDGGTSESYGYAIMMLNGIWRIPEALKNYTDPESFSKKTGFLDKINLYRWPRYRAVWDGFVRGMLSNLDYPLYADNRLPCHFSDLLANLLASNYPNGRHSAIQKIAHGQRARRCYEGRIAQYWYAGQMDHTAPFYQKEENRKEERPQWSDDLSPALGIGTLRQQGKSEDSLVSLSVAQCFYHAHLDHLNLCYWKNGHECLSDLGYLWDMAKLRPFTVRTLAHNTVVVDEGNQLNQVERSGGFDLFSARDPGFKVMEASSRAYEQTSMYQRTIVVLNEGGKEVVVDIFRCQGGQIHDWVMHGPHKDYQWRDASESPYREPLYDLDPVRRIEPEGTTSLQWLLADGQAFQVYFPVHEEETVFLGHGFGQRKARDQGSTLPYLIRRRSGSEPNIFVTVYAGSGSVDQVKVHPVNGFPWLVIVEIMQNNNSRFLLSNIPSEELAQTRIGNQSLHFDGRIGYLSKNKNILIGGTRLRYQNTHIQAGNSGCSGRIKETFTGENFSGFYTDTPYDTVKEIKGLTLSVHNKDGGYLRYPVIDVRQSDGRTLVVTRLEHDGYDIYEGEYWNASNQVHS